MSFENLPQSINQGISNSRGYLDEKANALLAPKTAKGVSGFLFDVPDRESIDLSSDITDHFTEDNSFINDHIVRKPITITLTGFTGELVFEKAEGVAGAVQEIQNRLSTVPAYLPEWTDGALQTVQNAVSQAQAAVSAINQTLDRVQNVVGLFDGEGPEDTRQQKAYQELFALWQSQDLVTVQTPWAYFDSMVISMISLSQTGDSKEISDISVSIKEFRVAEVKTVNFDQDLFPPREEIQSGEEEDQGNIRGQDRNVSFLFAAREALQ